MSKCLQGSQREAWDEVFRLAFQNPFLDGVRDSVEERFQPSLDVDETDQAYFLSLDVPGVRKEDVKIESSGNVLTISGERKQEKRSNTKSIGRYERAFGRFSRRFTLPTIVDANRIEAKLEDGVLKVELPKAEQARPRLVEVQSSK